MDRIEINGVWYVRETPESPSSNFEFREIDLTKSDQFIETRELNFYTNQYDITFSTLINKTGGCSMEALEIEFADGRKKEYWDNGSFLSGLANLDQESLDSALEIEIDGKPISKGLLNVVINLLKIAQNKGLLK